jgi:choline dehydrogenase-like flavoprotein
MPKEKVDVLIVGSGHSGGMAANILTGKGISCLLLNAGPVFDLQKDRELKSAYTLPFRGFGRAARLPQIPQITEFNENAWVDSQEVPYTVDPQDPYNWVRVRLYGGRSLFWGRKSFRLSDFEFKAKDHDGFGENWPISLADLAPYYSRVESIFHVQGHTDGLLQYPDGNFIEDNSPWSGSMRRFIDAAKQMEIPVCKNRAALGVDGWASSLNLLLPGAFSTGKLKTVPNAVVRELSVDKNTGLVDGAHFVHRHSRREMSVKARVVILAASTLESTRLLLNSQVTNSSGVLGHYLIDQVYGPGIVCSVPEARDGKGASDLMGGDALIPRFRNIKSRAKNFIRGYALNAGSSKRAMSPRCFAAYGEDLAKKIDSYYGSGFSISMMGEVLPYPKHRVTIDKDQVDAWNIPVLHVETQYTTNEFNMARDAVDTATMMAQAAGFEVLAKNYEPDVPGSSIHELGTCRMGNDPKTSVLNQWNQSHDIKNLFVVDGGCFVSAGWQNPTMTILALAMRASEYLADQMRQGNV